MEDHPALAAGLRAWALAGLVAVLAGCVPPAAPTAPVLTPTLTRIPAATTPATAAPTESATPTVVPPAAPTGTFVPTATPAPSATPAPASWLLYVSERDGDLEIYRVDADGGGMRPLTDSDAAEADPVWSPDGRRIAYTSTWWGDPDIFLMDADGGDVVQVTANSGADTWPAWSPDGQWLVFSSDRDELDRFNLYRVPADCRAGNAELGARGAKVCEASVEAVTDSSDAIDVYPAWSPGARVIYAADRGGASGFDIYTVLPGEAPARFAASVHTDWFPHWSPDGTRVVFASERDGAFALFIADRDGANVHEVAAGAVTPLGFPVWSPDGTKLAFVGVADGARDVYVVDVAGGEPARLTDDGQVIAVGDWAMMPK